MSLFCFRFCASFCFGLSLSLRLSFSLCFLFCCNTLLFRFNSRLALSFSLGFCSTVLVVGLGPIYRWLSADVLSTNPIWLCFAYVIL